MPGTRQDSEQSWFEMQEINRAAEGGDADAVVRFVDRAHDPGVRLHAVTVIRRRRLTDAASAIAGYLADEEDDELRAAIAGTLADLAQPVTADAFFRALSDGSGTVRRLALRGLGNLDDLRAADVAERMYRDGDFWIRDEALDVLAGLRTRESRDVLDRLMRGGTFWQRLAVRRALRRHRPGGS